MKIIMTPSFPGNAYQRLLVSALEQEGVDVVLEPITRVLPFTRAVLRHWRPDVVQLEWAHPLFLDPVRWLIPLRLVSLLLDLVLLRLLSVPLVWTVHNKWNHERRLLWLDLAVSRLLAEQAVAIKVECVRARETIRELFKIRTPSKIHVIPMGGYGEAYRNEVGQREAREALGLPDDAKVFLFFGFMRPYKGVLELLQAFQPQQEGTLLLLVGKVAPDDPYGMEVRDRAAAVPSVRAVFEYIPDEHLHLYLNAADVVVLPYKDLLSSSAVLLASTFGRAVVAPRLGCIPDAVDEKGAFLYEGDTAQLARALQEAEQSSREVLAEMGTYNYAHVNRREWATIAARTKELYASLRDFER